MIRKIGFVAFLSIFFYSCSTKEQRTPAEKAPSETNAIRENPVEKISLPKGDVISTVACSNDTTQSFALYLPGNYSDQLKFPVLIFLDPHGDGSFPLRKYKSLADKFGYILMGSNSCKNGLTFDQTNRIAGLLIKEATSRLSSDENRISLAGFSGGAKAALMAASVHPMLASVIYCGAAIPFSNISQLPPALGFAGLRDMNYVEVGNSSAELYKKKIFHSFIEWNGKHEWPDATVFEDAFYWCDLLAMRNKSKPYDEKHIQIFSAKITSALLSKQTAIEQCNSCTKAIAFLQGLVDVSSYQNRLETITRSPGFREEMLQRQNLFQLESDMKSNYMQCFDSKDLSWWNAEINRIRSVKGEQELMYQRVMGYLSLASYTFADVAVRQNNFAAAQKFLAIYKLADPENPEQPFLVACLSERQGDEQKALASLREAIRLGLKDKAKIESEESFIPLRSNAEFKMLLSRL